MAERRYDLKPITRPFFEKDRYSKRMFRRYTPPTDEELIARLSPTEVQAFIDALETGRTDERIPAWAALPNRPPDRRVKRLAKILRARQSPSA